MDLTELLGKVKAHVALGAGVSGVSALARLARASGRKGER